MKRKIIWLVASCLIVLALVLSSCRPAAVEEEKEERVVGKAVEKEEAVEKKVKEEVKEQVVAEKEVPRYGGLFTSVMVSDPPSGFDPWTVHAMTFCNMVYDHLAIGDIMATEKDWGFMGNYIAEKIKRGMLAESWETPEPSTVIFHLRKGVHFQNLPPVNGREVVADDVVYSFNRIRSPQSPADKNILRFVQSITAPDKYTVVFKFDPPQVMALWGLSARSSTWIIPHETVEKYGNLSDWRVHVGTGPFIAKDFVSGSSMTFKKNPNYWEIDPRYPGNRLPYFDDVQILIIPDSSTILAALRTGKIDFMGGLTRVGWESTKSLEETNPEIPHRQIILEQAVFINLRTDKEPFSDKRVRQALNMAINRQEIVDELMDGHALLGPTWPFAGGWTGLFTPIEKLPDNVRQIYEYNPDKAKKLLAEAGYPNGFKTEIILPGSATGTVDTCTLIQKYLADIGVELEMKPLEYGAWVNQWLGGTFKAMNIGVGGLSSPIFGFSWFAPGTAYNWNKVNNQYYNDKYLELSSTFDEAERNRLSKELALYALEQAYQIDLPLAYSFIFWQPWVKGGYWGQCGLVYNSTGDLYKYLWLDLDVKKAVTGRR